MTVGDDIEIIVALLCQHPNVVKLERRLDGWDWSTDKGLCGVAYLIPDKTIPGPGNIDDYIKTH